MRSQVQILPARPELHCFSIKNILGSNDWETEMEWDKNKNRNNEIKKLLLEGNSICSIAKKLNCSKGTVYYYAEKHGWWHNDKIQKERKGNFLKNSRFASEANQEKWNQKRYALIEEAKNEWPKIKDDPKISMFLGLYWGEGNKRNGIVGITNNDPGIIKFCYDFIKENTDSKIEIVVRCYPEHNWDDIQIFWQNLLAADIKIREKKWLGKKRRCWSEYGICCVRASDWRFYLKIIVWIGLWRAEITKTKLEINPNESIARSGLYSTIEYINSP